MSETIQRNLAPARGTVAWDFYTDNHERAAIMGPVGSAKTTTTIARIVRHALEQKPHSATGERIQRWVCIRQTYRDLWRTTIPSWFKSVPKAMGEFSGSRDNPATHVVPLAFPGLGKATLIMEFVALGDNDIEDVMRGYEPTAFWFNEADTLAQEVYQFARGRVGRFPDTVLDDDGRMIDGPTFKGILMDFNAPDDLNWVAEKIVYGSTGLDAADEAPLPGMKVIPGLAYFEQPPAVFELAKAPAWAQGGTVHVNGVDSYVINPRAENIRRLPPGYYASQIEGSDRSYITRMLGNVPAPAKSGKPVYEADYRPDFHVSKHELMPIPALPLLIGADAGRTPAAVIGQLLSTGQLMVLDELTAEGVAGRKFAELLMAHMEPMFGDWMRADPASRAIQPFGDPAAQYGSENSEDSWLKILRDATGWRWKPAPVINNNLQVRLDSVRHFMRWSPEPGQPGLLISPRCRDLRRALASGYKFVVIKVGDNRTADAPLKDEHSHIANGLEYLAVGAGGAEAVLRGQRRKDTGLRQTRASDDDHPGEWEGTQAAPVKRGRHVPGRGLIGGDNGFTATE